MLKRLPRNWTAESLTGRLLNGVLVGGFSTVIAQASSLLTYILVARILGKVKYGEFAMIQTSVTLAAGLAVFGLDTFATSNIPKLRLRSARAAHQLALQSEAIVAGFGLLLAGLAVTGLANRIAASVSMGQLSQEFRIGSLLLVAIALYNLQTGIVYGFELFRDLARNNMVRAVVTPALLVYGAIAGAIQGVLAALICINVLSQYLNRRAVWRQRRSECFSARELFSNLRPDAGFMLRFCCPVVIIALINSAATWFSLASLANTAASYAQVAVFTVALQWRTALTTLSALISNPVLPILSSLHSAGEYTRYRRSARWTLGLVLSGMMLGTSLIYGFAPYIMASYGGSFGDGATPLRILSLSVLGAGISYILRLGFTSIGRTDLSLYGQAIWGATLTLMGYPLAHRAGAAGLAYAYVAAESVQALFLGACFAWIGSGQRAGVSELCAVPD